MSPSKVHVCLRLVHTQSGRFRWLHYLVLLSIPLLITVLAALGLSKGATGFATMLAYLILAAITQFLFPVQILTEVGQLLSFDDELVLQTQRGEQRFPLTAATVIKLTYRGYKNDYLAPRIYADGLRNFIQLNGGEEYQFVMPNEREQEQLRRELRRWYIHKVALREYRYQNRTFLLYADPSYEQSREFQQEFKIKLYS